MFKKINLNFVISSWSKGGLESNFHEAMTFGDRKSRTKMIMITNTLKINMKNSHRNRKNKKNVKH